MAEADPVHLQSIREAGAHIVAHAKDCVYVRVVQVETGAYNNAEQFVCVLAVQQGG